MTLDKTDSLKKEIATLIYSRVSGYYNPTINFNKGKREEFRERKMINIDEFKTVKKEFLTKSGV